MMTAQTREQRAFLNRVEEHRFYKEGLLPGDTIRSITAARPDLQISRGLVLKFFGLTSLVLEGLDSQAGTATSARMYCVNTRLAQNDDIPPHFPSLCVPRLALMDGTSDADGLTPDIALFSLKNSRVRISGGGAAGLQVNVGPPNPACPIGPIQPGLGFFLHPAGTIFQGTVLHPPTLLDAFSEATIEIDEGRFEHADDVSVGDKFDRPTQIDIGGNTKVVRQVLYYGLPTAAQVRIDITSKNGAAPRTVLLKTGDTRVVAGIGHLPNTEGLAVEGTPLDDLVAIGLLLTNPGNTAVPTFQRFCDGFDSPLCGCCPPDVFP